MSKPEPQKESQKEPQKEVPKTDKKTKPSQLYYTVRKHIEDLNLKGKHFDQVSPDTSEYELQEILYKIHAMHVL